MKFISATEFDQMAQAGGLIPEEGSYYYADANQAFGFDLTNLTVPAQPDQTEDNREVERAMLQALFALAGELELFPMTLSPVGGVWFDQESGAALAQEGILDDAEKAMVASIAEGGKERDFLVVEQGEEETAIGLALLMMTRFERDVIALGREGLCLITASFEEEVSFDTADQAIYQQTRDLIKEREATFPFDIIFGDDIGE